MTHTFPYACVKKCYKFYSITFLMFVKKSVLSMKKKFKIKGTEKKKKKVKHVFLMIFLDFPTENEK